MSVRRYVIQLTLTVVVIVGTFVWTLLGDDRPVLGLDLQGGVSIVLFPVEGSDTSALDPAADIIRNRVDALGIAEPEVNRQGDTIVVDLPGVSDRARAEELVGQTAELRFRLAQGFVDASEGVPTTTVAPTTMAGETTTTVEGGTTTTVPADTSTTVEGESLGRTVPTAPIAAQRPAQEATTTTPPDETPTTVAGATPTTAAGETPVTEPAPGTTCEELVATREENLDPAATVYLWDMDETGCFFVGPTLLTGTAINTATARYAEGTGGWFVEVEFDNDDFATQVAQPFVGQLVAIELDGVVQSAPRINEGITGNNVVIEGDFSEGEARDLALVLRYGSLPVQFDPAEQTVQSISPSLGKDQLRAGIVAGVIGLALVALYMIAYYRMLGLVVWIGLALTGMLFFTITTWLSAN